MFELKKISSESIPEALEKAERYRLLNEPVLAESICLDILEADPQNSKAIIIIILAITDQFDSAAPEINRAKQLLDQLPGDYERYYYGGIICERQGKSMLFKGIPDSSFIAYEWLYDAMELFEKAESVRPVGNDDAILRWNTCARLIMRHHLQPRDEKQIESQLE